jgi:GntR family transcriptional regulator, phosphonate transport system regulatory protein
MVPLVYITRQLNCDLAPVNDGLVTATMMRRAQVSGPGKMSNHEAAAAGISLWRRIADELEQSIANGAFEAGSKMPGEIEMAMRFGVNRHTVRRAIAALAHRGLLRAERGSGTFVEAKRISYPIRQRTRFSEIVGGAGRAAGGRLVSGMVEPAASEIAARLKLKARTSVVRLEIIRQADRIPISAVTSWLAAARFPGAARVYGSTHSMTRMLAHFGVRDYVRKSTHISAVLADAADAGRLKVTLGRPILVVESVDVDGDGCPVLTTRSRFAADRLEFVIES